MSKITEGVKSFGVLLKETFVRYVERDPFRNSAVIAYYTIFSLPGLLVIIVNLAGYFFGEEAVTNKISSQVQGTIGPQTARDVEKIVADASSSEGTVLSTIISVAVLIFGATGVFYQLQQTLNIMWQVEPDPKRKFLKLVKDRIFSFGLILVIGFLLLVSLVLSAALSAMSDWVTTNLSEAFNILFKVLDFAISLGVVTLLFAAIYKYLPDARIKWRDVWIGALLTGVLFVIAKFLLGLYFGNSDPASAYGAASSIVLIMLWVTYSGMILFFGAEFTLIYANKYGAKIRPVDYARSTKHSKDPKKKSTSFSVRMKEKSESNSK